MQGAVRGTRAHPFNVGPCSRGLPSAQRAFKILEALIEVGPAILLGRNVLCEERFFRQQSLHLGASPSDFSLEFFEIVFGEPSRLAVARARSPE